MGLDAVVYLKKDKLPFDADALGALLDVPTGEYYFLDPELDRKFPSNTRRAVEKRIGNIAMVSYLRDQAEQVLDKNSVVLSKVLYSGSHSGDSIDVQFLARLEEELLLLRNSSMAGSSTELLTFVTDMNELVMAAKSQGNPIVF